MHNQPSLQLKKTFPIQTNVRVKMLNKHSRRQYLPKRVSKFVYTYDYIFRKITIYC